MQVSKPTKDTAEARYTADVVNELSDVLQKTLQVSMPLLFLYGDCHVVALYCNDLCEQLCAGAGCCSCMPLLLTVSRPQHAVPKSLNMSCAPGCTTIYTASHGAGAAKRVLSLFLCSNTAEAQLLHTWCMANTLDACALCESSL